jgi:hypothetical protein
LALFRELAAKGSAGSSRMQLFDSQRMMRKLLLAFYEEIPTCSRCQGKPTVFCLNSPFYWPQRNSGMD